MCSSKFDPSLWLRNHSPIKWGKVHNVHGCKWQNQGWKWCLWALHLVRLVCKATNPEKRRQGKHQQTPWAEKCGHWVSRLWARITVFRFGILIYEPLAARKPSSLFTSSKIVPTWLSWCCLIPPLLLPSPPGTLRCWHMPWSLQERLPLSLRVLRPFYLDGCCGFSSFQFNLY